MDVREESGFILSMWEAVGEFGLGRVVISSFSRTFSGCSVVTPASRTSPRPELTQTYISSSPHFFFSSRYPWDSKGAWEHVYKLKGVPVPRGELELSRTDFCFERSPERERGDDPPR